MTKRILVVEDQEDPVASSGALISTVDPENDNAQTCQSSSRRDVRTDRQCG